MTRRIVRTGLCLAVLLLGSGQGRAQTRTPRELMKIAAGVNPTLHGILSGLNLTYTTAVGLVLKAGSGWIDAPGVNQSFQLATDTNIGQAPSLSGAGGGLAASTAYYCYVISCGNNCPAAPAFAPATYSFVCDVHAPLCDGHPPVNLSIGASAPTTSALFVGSFITNAASAILPFHRNGEEVIVNTPVTVAQQDGNTFDNGIWHPNTLTFPAAAQPGGQANNSGDKTFAVPLPAWYPGSASAGIFDVYLQNFSVGYLQNGSQVPGAAQKIDFLDPSSSNPPPVPLPAQAFVFIEPPMNLPPPVAIPSRETIRLRLNAPLLLFRAGTNDPTATVNVDLVLRGYVEPVHNLCPR